MKAWKKEKNGTWIAILLGACLFSFPGCLSNDDSSDDGKVKITDLKVTPGSAKAGGSVDVEGTVASSAGLTVVRVNIWKGAVDVTADKGFTVTQTALAGSLKAWSLKTDGNVKIAVGGAAAVGDYTVQVTAKSGTDSAVATTALKVTGTAVILQEVTLGSNQNAAGGSLDLDEMMVYSHAVAKAVSGKIDLYYAHSATEGDKLFTPLQAKISGFGDSTNGPATWTVANGTLFRKLNLSESAFAGITTQEAIDDLWGGGEVIIGGSDPVAEGATYIVNTDMAKKVLIRVTAYVPGSTGTITVKGSK